MRRVVFAMMALMGGGAVLLGSGVIWMIMVGALCVGVLRPRCASPRVMVVLIQWCPDVAPFFAMVS